MILENTFFELLGNDWTLLDRLLLWLLTVVWTARAFISNRCSNSFWGICHYYNWPSASQTAFSMKEIIPKWLPNYPQTKRAHLLPITHEYTNCRIIFTLGVFTGVIIKNVSEKVALFLWCCLLKVIILPDYIHRAG